MSSNATNTFARVLDWAYAYNVVVQADMAEKDRPKGKHSGRRWLWPLGFVTTGVAGTALLLLRGCWHRKMSWPIRVEGFSYQVCLSCGVKRLFDEGTFRGYGAYSYSLHDLIAHHRAVRLKARREAEEKIVSAS